MKKFTSFLKMLFLGFWSLFMILFSMTLMFITFNNKIAVICASKIWAPVVLWVFGVKVEVKGLEKVKPGDIHIVMSNHSSYLDIPVLFSLLPYNLYFIAKKELEKVPFLGFYMNRVGMIFIDRGNNQAARESMEQAGEIIRNGKCVVIFPEGTSKAGAEIGPFKKGGFFLTQNAKVPILPIRIKGTSSIWPSHNNLNLNKGNVEVNIGAPIDIVPKNKEEVDELTNKVRETIINLG